MTKSRFSQLRNLAMTRDKTTRSTKDTNRDQITRSTKELNEDFMSNIPSEIIEDLILRYIRDEDISMRDLERINILAYRGTGTMNDPSVGILQNLFAILTEKILLPDYIDEDDVEGLYYEIAGIVDRTKARALQTFGKNHHNSFFTAHLPNVDTIRAEFENFGQMEDRYIDLGGVFETIEISNHPTLGMHIHMPVRIASAHIMPSGNKKKNKDPVIPQKQLNYVVKSVMHYFCARTKDRKSKDECYQMTVGRTHFQVTINPEGATRNKNTFGKQETLSEILIETAEGINDSMSDQDILDRLQDVIKVIQEMANRIAEKSGFPHEHRHYVMGWDFLLQDEVEFFIEDPDVTEEDGDDYHASACASQQQNFAQFENLRVKMNEKISLGDVGGNPQAKEEVEKIIKSIKFSEIMRSWGAKPTSGIVFEWPAGTGKTLLAKAVASEVDAEVYNIKMTDIATSAYINTGSNNVQKLFAFIRQKAQNNKKIVVILDELDALFGKRGDTNGSREDTKIVNTFLTEMSGFDTMENVIFIGTTNLLENIDPAVIRSGRLTTKVKVDLPNTDGLKQIYQIHLDKLRKISKKFYHATEQLDIDAIARQSDKLSGADVEEVVRIVAQTKAMEEIDGNHDKEITEKYFFDAIEKVKNSNQKHNMGFV